MIPSAIKYAKEYKEGEDAFKNIQQGGLRNLEKRKIMLAIFKLDFRDGLL